MCVWSCCTELAFFNILHFLLRSMSFIDVTLHVTFVTYYAVVFEMMQPHYISFTAIHIHITCINNTDILPVVNVNQAQHMFIIIYRLLRCCSTPPVGCATSPGWHLHQVWCDLKKDAKKFRPQMATNQWSFLEIQWYCHYLCNAVSKLYIIYCWALEIESNTYHIPITSMCKSNLDHLTITQINSASCK